MPESINSMAEEAREALTKDLTERAAKFRLQARSNERRAAICYGIAILGSIAATLSALVFEDEQLPRKWLAAISSIAGCALLVLNVFAFDKRAAWQRKRKRMYDQFSDRLKFEGADAAQISSERRVFEEQIQAEFPRFGALAEPKMRQSGTT